MEPHQEPPASLCVHGFSCSLAVSAYGAALGGLCVSGEAKRDTQPPFWGPGQMSERRWPAVLRAFPFALRSCKVPAIT